MAGIMLRSLASASSFSSERTPLPCFSERPWPSGTGKVKTASDPVRASPYPPLARSSPSGFGSAAGAKRVSRSSTPLKRTPSLHGGDSLAALQKAANEATKPAKPRRTGSRPLRPAPSFVNTLPAFDVLVCPPPVPLSRCEPLPVPTPPPVTDNKLIPPPVRRRSSLAPAPSAPTALVARAPTVLPSPPTFVQSLKKKREPLAQRMLRRTFERTPRGAQVKALGAHAAMRMMSEVEEEAAVAASVVVINDDEDVSMTDSWVQVDREEMEWNIIDADD